jgi:transposase
MPIMETVGKKEPRPRRSFTREFKAEIVEACLPGDGSIGQVARDFDLTETAVRKWVRQAAVDAGRRDRLATAEWDELAELRRENRRLREDIEILKRGHILTGAATGALLCRRGVDRQQPLVSTSAFRDRRRRGTEPTNGTKRVPSRSGQG